MARQNLQNILGSIAIGIGSFSAGCNQTNFQVSDHIRGHEKNTISQKDAPYNLELISLYGSTYSVQSNPKSATGFSLLPYDELIATINEQGKTIGLSTENVYFARQFLVEQEKAGEKVKIPATKISLSMTGPRAIKAEREEITHSNGLDTRFAETPDYDIKTLKVNNEEFYFPNLKQENVKENRLNFLTIPRNGHLRKIHPDGKIELINPRNIYEWINKSVIETEQKLAEEAKIKFEQEKEAEARKRIKEMLKERKAIKKADEKKFTGSVLEIK